MLDHSLPFQRTSGIGAKSPEARTSRRQPLFESLESRRLFAGNGLTATFFNNQNLTSQVLTRVDPTVNFNWGYNAPNPAVSQAHFSARWLGQVQAVGTGTYTFSTQSDDGIRLWVNGQEIINDWTDHPQTTDQGSISLAAGAKYNIRLEYYQDTGGAVCTLSWSSPSVPFQIVPQSNLYAAGNGLAATYFNGMTLGTPVLSRVDQTVNFNWAGASPAAGVNANQFSARWTGQVQALTSETYTFSLLSDDGARLWVNGQEIINDWTDHPATMDYGSIALNAGQNYTIKLEYYQDTGGSECILGWATPTIPQQFIPTASLYSVSASDTTPPTTPTGVYIASKTASTATVDWTASTDNVGVAGYTIYRGSVAVGTAAANATTFTDTGLSAGTLYTYTVAAFDAAGNASPMSASAMVTTLASGPTAPPIAGNWNLSFDDEFNSLNSSTWSNDYWWGGNAGTQATFDPKQLSVNNGVLAQTAVASPETANNGVTNPYRSGLMTTGGIKGVTPASFTFTYGYVETRAQIAPGTGMWSAFWMLPADYNDNYEIDVYENLGRLPSNDQGFYHAQGAVPGNFSMNTGTDLTKGFHTYGLDWEPNAITWYLDGKAVYSTSTNIINRPMYLLMNLDVGGAWAGPLDSTSPATSSWYTDYVHVWQHPTTA